MISVYTDGSSQSSRSLRPVGGEVGEDANLVTVGDQPAHQMVPEEPCASGDEGAR
jgi:hypothetical protein